MAEKKNRPEIRFKGFTDEWAVRKFSETFTKIPNNTLSRDELNYNSGQAKNVHYGDVLIKFGELLDVEKDEIPYITNDALVNKIKSSKLQSGDVIIADTAEDETVGKCTELVNLGIETIFSGLHTIPSRPTLPFAPGYLGYFMNSSAYHTQLLRLMQGTKVSSISKAALQDTAIVYPIDSVEQSQIGNFFKSVGHLITLHQRKYDKLVTVKKALLEKMFPKDGAVVPEIRFKGFTEDWEKMRLGEVGNLKNGMNFGKEAMGHGYPFVNLQDVFGKNTVDDTNLGLAVSNENQRKEYSIQKGDVLFIRSSVKPEGVGETAVVTKNFENTTFSGFIIRFRPNIEMNENFNRFVYSIAIIRNQILKSATSSANTNINQESLKNIQLMLPNIGEQSKIGSFLNRLDNLITLQQRELEKLKNIKKACLEKMFV